MSEETTIYESNDIKVTNLRAVFGSKTYAVSNITAVETETKPPSGCMPLITLGGGALFVFINLSVLFNVSSYNAASNNDGSWGGLLAGVILLVAGIAFIRSSKNEYVVKISTASGEIRAYSSPDKQDIEKIVESLNTAIIQKG